MSVDKTNTIKNISVDELKQILDKKEITLYDVRTPDEFGERHIKQAENKPLDTLADFEPEQKKLTSSVKQVVEVQKLLKS